MPIRHAGILAKRTSTWLRDHFWRNTMPPRTSKPTTWNEFLPISIPITVIVLLSLWDMGAPCLWRPLPDSWRAGQEHGRTIPLAEILGSFPDDEIHQPSGNGDLLHDVLACQQLL